MNNPNELITLDSIDHFMSVKMSNEEFCIQELDHEGTFESLSEFQLFLSSILIAWPDGVPFEYYYQKINAYRTNKLIGGLISKGLITETEDEDGGTAYKATQFGADVINSLKLEKDGR